MVLLCIDQMCFCFHSMAASKQMDKFHFTEFLLELQAEGSEEMLKQHVSVCLISFQVTILPYQF